MKKGFYFIVVHDTDNQGERFSRPELSEGSFEYHGRLFVHRDSTAWRKSHKWKVSHIDSGSNIASDKTLSQARELAKALQGFKLWELKTHESIKQAIAEPSNGEQVIKIKHILGLS